MRAGMAGSARAPIFCKAQAADARFAGSEDDSSWIFSFTSVCSYARVIPMRQVATRIATRITYFFMTYSFVCLFVPLWLKSKLICMEGQCLFTGLPARATFFTKRNFQQTGFRLLYYRFQQSGEVRE